MLLAQEMREKQEVNFLVKMVEEPHPAALNPLWESRQVPEANTRGRNLTLEATTSCV